MRRAPWATAGAAGIALLLAACTTQGLAFRVDERIEIVSPADREEVTFPFTLSWTARDFAVGSGTIGGDGNYFAVFMDRTPLPPGAHIKALGDDPCKRTPGCPDEQWLADRFMYVTTGTSLLVESVPDVDSEDLRARDLHEITIVLMDANDRRIGESAFSVEYFTVEEE